MFNIIIWLILGTYKDDLTCSYCDSACKLCTGGLISEC
jgi:hypothetical protein